MGRPEEEDLERPEEEDTEDVLSDTEEERPEEEDTEEEESEEEEPEEEESLVVDTDTNGSGEPEPDTLGDTDTRWFTSNSERVTNSSRERSVLDTEEDTE